LKGNGEESLGSSSSGNYLPTCTERRLHIVQIEPFRKQTGEFWNYLSSKSQTYVQSASANAGTMMYWRPFGITYNQEFDITNKASPFSKTLLSTHFRPVHSANVGILLTNTLDPMEGMMVIEHQSSITDKLTECVPVDSVIKH
jgi:hypothetical protein